MEFSRQEYWSGLPFPSLEDLHDPGVEPESPTLQADSLRTEPGKRLFVLFIVFNKYMLFGRTRVVGSVVSFCLQLFFAFNNLG